MTVGRSVEDLETLRSQILANGDAGTLQLPLSVEDHLPGPVAAESYYDGSVLGFSLPLLRWLTPSNAMRAVDIRQSHGHVQLLVEDIERQQVRVFFVTLRDPKNTYGMSAPILLEVVELQVTRHL